MLPAYVVCVKINKVKCVNINDIRCVKVDDVQCMNINDVKSNHHTTEARLQLFPAMTTFAVISQTTLSCVLCLPFCIAGNHQCGIAMHASCVGIRLCCEA